MIISEKHAVQSSEKLRKSFSLNYKSVCGSVTSGNRRMAARLSSVVRCVYWRETAALSCPTISRAIKSETPAAFSTAVAEYHQPAVAILLEHQPLVNG